MANRMSMKAHGLKVKSMVCNLSVLVPLNTEMEESTVEELR